MFLVTGGGGFIGRQVCQTFFERGFEVVALDRQFPTAAPYRQISGDIGDPDFLAGVIKGGQFETVIHLAAILKTASLHNPQESVRVNINGSLHLLELAAAANVSKFIYGSSITAYGPKPFSDFGEVSEDAPLAPNTIYGASKRFVELVGQNYNGQGKMQFIGVRIGMVVGPGAKNTSTPWRSQIFETLAGKPPARINITFGESVPLPLIFLNDVAEVFCELHKAERPAQTFYNAPTENWQGRELADYLLSLNPNLEITFSPNAALTDPEANDSRRFTEEFAFRPVSLRERFKQFAAS